MRLFVHQRDDSASGEPTLGKKIALAVPKAVNTVAELGRHLLGVLRPNNGVGHGNAAAVDGVAMQNGAPTSAVLRLHTQGYALLPEDPVRGVLRDGEHLDVREARGKRQPSGSLAEAGEAPKPKRSKLGFITDAVRQQVFGRTGLARNEHPLAGAEDGEPARVLVSYDDVSASADAAQKRQRRKRLVSEVVADDIARVQEASRSEKPLRLVGEMAPAQVRWRYPVCDEELRSFAGHLPNALSLDAARQLMDAAVDGVDWLQPKGRFGPIPRKTAWMTRSPCSCSYSYGGAKIPPASFAPWVLEAMKLCFPLCGLDDPDTWPDSCNLNLYEDGQHSVAWHADDEPFFQGLTEDCMIVSLSLGEPRSFDVKTHGGQLHRLELGAGDLCTMEGLFQKNYLHRVPKDNQLRCGPRVNLTWRWMKAHNPGCELHDPSKPCSVPSRQSTKPRADWLGPPPKRQRAAGSASSARSAGWSRSTSASLRSGPPMTSDEVQVVLVSDGQARQRWLKQAVQKVKTGELAARSLYDVVAADAFAVGLSEALGSRLYRVVHANLGLFSSDEREFLDARSALAKTYSGRAFDGIKDWDDLGQSRGKRTRAVAEAQLLTSDDEAMRERAARLLSCACKDGRLSALLSELNHTRWVADGSGRRDLKRPRVA